MELWEIGCILKKRYEEKKTCVMKKYSLTSAEIDVLSILDKFTSIKTSTDIVNVSQLQKSHVSLAINSLINKNLLKKEYVNKKSFNLLLTNNCNSIILDINKFQKELINELNQGLTEDELSTYFDITNKIISNIEKFK